MAYEAEIEKHTEVERKLHKRTLELTQEIEEAKKVITKNETLVGRLWDTRELNGKVLSHYNYLNAQDNEDRRKVLRYDLEDYNRMEEILKHLESQ